MATAWKVAAATAVVGWLVSPIITYFLPKIISCLGFDTSQKLRQLEFSIIPDLEKTLAAVDQERMLERGNRKKSEVAVLDKMAGMLRHAQEDAEDIFDDAEAIELYRNRCWQRLYGPVKACIARWSDSTLDELNDTLAKVAKVQNHIHEPTMMSHIYELKKYDFKYEARLALNYVSTTSRGDPTQMSRRHELANSLNNMLKHLEMETTGDASLMRRRDELTSKLVGLHGALASCKSRFMWLRRWARKIIALQMSEDDILPATTKTFDPSKEHIPATSDQQPSPVTVPSESWGWCLSCLCSFFHFLKNWFGIAVGFACFLRDWSYQVIGVTSNQENATALDFLVTAISRRSLTNRIEKVEGTISEINKSPLLGAARKSAPEDIANKNRSKIRASSNHKVFGREELRGSVMEKLRENPHGTSSCYSATGIYGVAGSGKTTFARYIRDFIEEQQRKEGKHFHTIMCIHVSEIFSVKDIFHEMLKDITNDRHSNISGHEELKEKLEESLRGKRFFLILDDLWVKTRNDPQLEELISPLRVGLKGSKILVTARTKVAAGALCVDEPIEMPVLDDDQYFSMFMHYAMGSTNVADEEFRRVGRLIAEKLHRSPIAAVAVAGRLGTNRDIKFWKNAANHGMLNHTMGALWWSYQTLNPDIRRCFEFCNIFPRRFKLKRDKLVHLWIAQGFVKTSCETEDMEDVAEGYIEELVSCSFLQPEESSSDTDCFTIHDLLHDLLDNVARNDCFRIDNARGQRVEGWKGDVPHDVRHLFIWNYDAKLITERITQLENLRTLIIYVAGDIDILAQEKVIEIKVIEIICKRLPKLRVLSVAFGYGRDRMPKVNYVLSVPGCIGMLKHLRYLSFRTFRKEVLLPSRLSELHHLQLLRFGPSIDLYFHSASLIKLRHIFCKSEVNCPNIGNLTSLQTLPAFSVRTNEQGYEVKQLSDLNKLRGKLVIHGIENVKTKEEALEANLAAKERLIDVSLRWGFDGSGYWSLDDTRCSPEVEAEIFDGLCPPAGLEKLEIWGYKGSRYPDWIVGKQNGYPKDLQQLVFWYCNQPGPAPELGEAFPQLRSLNLSCCDWDALPGNMEHLTSLKELDISLCPNIQSLPTLPQSLEMFRLDSWDNYEFVHSCQTVRHPNWQKIEHIPNKILNGQRMFPLLVSRRCGNTSQDECSDGIAAHEEGSDGITAYEEGSDGIAAYVEGSDEITSRDSDSDLQ